jgi:hypothetical protein
MNRRAISPLASIMNYTRKVLLVPIGLVLFVLSVEASRHRFVDADEGFYLLAARLVFHHKLPYVDFLYTQMPLLPYIYGLWMLLWGESWLSGRLFSACLTAGLGVLLYVHVCSRTKKWASAIFAVLLFSSSTLMFGWLPIVKTYAVSSLLLFTCYMLVIHISETSSKKTFVVCGLLLGVSMEVRLYLAAVLPVFLLWIWRHPKLVERGRRIAWFLAGFTFAALPAIWFLALDPGAFIFNNIGIHAMRSSDGLIGGLGQKLAVLTEVLVGGPRGNGVQLSTLLLLSMWLLRKQRMADAERLAFQLALVLGLICLAPTPTYVQYFCVSFPFLLTAAICSFGHGIGGNIKQKAWLKIAVYIGTVLYLAASTADYRKYFITGEGLNGIYLQKDPGNWTVSRVSAVSRAIDELAVPGEPVMSFWPGYMVESQAAVYPGFENDSGRRFSAGFPAERLKKLHLASRGSVETDIATRVPRIVVRGNQEYWHESQQPYVEALDRSGYVVARTVGDTSIYVRSDGSAR